MTPPKTRLSNASLIALLGFICALTPLAIDMYLPAMPAMAAAFNTPAAHVQQTLTAFSIGFAVGQLFVGSLSDSIGRRRVMLAGSVLFAVTALLCARAETIDQLILWRSLQGLAGAAAAVMISAIVRDLFEQNEFSRVMSFVILVMTIAPLVAPVLGGYFAVWLGWRSIFWVLAALGVFACALVAWLLPETLPRQCRQPLAINRTVHNYLVVLADPHSLTLMSASAFSYACLFTFLLSGAFVYIEVYGVATDKVAYLLAVNVIAVIALTSLNGRFVVRKGTSHMLRWGLYIQLLGGFLLLPAVFVEGEILLVLLPGMVVISATTMVSSNIMASLLYRHASIAGTASSVAGSFRFGFGALIGTSSTLLPFGLQANMALTVVLSVCAAQLCFRLHRRLSGRI